SSGPIWIAQLFLFAVGGLIELLLIYTLLQQAANGALQKDAGASKFIAIVAFACAAVAIIHQFLILRNLEVEHELQKRKQIVAECAAKQSCILAASSKDSQTKENIFLMVLNFLLTLVAVFLLAAITGEVPYLITLRLLTDGDSIQGIPHRLDFLNIFTNVPISADLEAPEFNERLIYYCKTLFFSASVLLAGLFIIWDILRLTIGQLKEDYSSRIRLPIWSIFLISDLLSFSVWVCLFLLLANHRPSMVKNESLVEFIPIISVTGLYAIMIGSRMGIKMLSPKNHLEIKATIV
ncbi:MAG TPA: hypothetical protein VNX46_02630, partial [Candidatus Acidoferrum sp.]|nr:hypothetical protein [Candidatus Acidoferrum sp.]